MCKPTSRDRQYTRVLGLSFAFALAVCTAPVHAEVDTLVQQAHALIGKGQFKEAFELLQTQEAQRAGDADFDLSLGIAANQSALYSRAIFALERVLLVQPENARARSELGRALFAVGDTQGARTLLQQTKDQGVPVEVAKTLDQFLQAIDKVDAAGRSSIKGYLDAGVGFDSNINSAPAGSTVAVPYFGGALLTLSPGNTVQSGTFATAGAGLSGRKVLDPRWSLIGNVTAATRSNTANAVAFDTQQYDFNGGASYRVDRNEFSVVAQYGTSDVANSRAREQSGIVAEWVYRLDGFRQFSSYLQSATLTYPGQSLRNAQRDVLGTSYAHLFRDGLMVYGGGYVGSEKETASGVAYLGHTLIGLRGGVQKPFSETLAAFATVAYEERTYGGTEPLFLVSRKDQQTNLSLGLSWVPVRSWRITPLLSFTQTASNVAIDAFDKSAISVTVRREF